MSTVQFNLEEILVDIDNVIYDLESVNLAFIKQTYGVQLTSRDVKTWDFYMKDFPDITKVWGDFQLYSQGQFFDGANQFLQDLQLIAPVKIITASYDSIIEEKDKFLQDNLVLNNIEIIHAKNKSLFTSKGVLIDDAPHNIFDHTQKNNQPGLLFDLNGGYGWGKNIPLHHLIKRVRNYEEVLHEVENLFRNRS